MSGLTQRADMAVSDLTSNGGLLTVGQNNQFIRTIIDQPTMLREARTVPMDRPSQEFNKIQFGSRILHPAPGGTSPYAEDDGTNDRYLAAANRSNPATSKVTVTTKEAMAEVHLPYDVLEDNIERGGMADTVLTLIAERAALDLEEGLIQGDVSLVGSDPYLGQQDGILVRSTAHVVDAGGAPMSAQLLNTAKKAMPTKYRRQLQQLRWWVAPDIEDDYRLTLASRQTALGDATITGASPVTALGVQMRGVALMPTASALLCAPQNVIVGIQRNIRIEADRDIRARTVIFVLTLRIGYQIEETDAMVKITNIAEQ